MFDIPFHINLFISLIELENPLKHQIKEHTCKLKIDKKPTQSCRLAKISLYCILNIQSRISKFLVLLHSCTNCYNLEMEPKYLTKSDV